MGFLDLIRRGVVEQFSGTIPTNELIFSLITAFAAGMFVAYVYKKTFTGVAYSKTSILHIVLLAMITSLVIRTISSNLALSLGMVGALSIVRFRTAVKDPIDTAFMFWSITVGIMAGAGLYVVTFMATILLGMLYIVTFMITFKQSSKYLLVINVDEDNAEGIINKVTKRNKCILKTQSIKKGNVELTFEIVGKDSAKYLLELKKNRGVDSLHLVNID